MEWKNPVLSFKCKESRDFFTPKKTGFDGWVVENVFSKEIHENDVPYLIRK